MRPHGKTKLGFFPLPTQEAERLKGNLRFDSEFSALDACVGDGAAFTCLLKNTPARRYGIEIDANRAEQARNLGIETVQANSMDVRCPAESLSLLLSQRSVRPGSRSDPQSAFGIGVSGAHLSLAETRRCPGVCDPPATTQAVREDSE